LSRSFLILIFCLLIALALLAPIVPRLGDALIYPSNAQYSDLTITHWPAFAYTRDHLQSTGQLPMWRTSILSGTPFAADPLAGLFYPPHWFAFISAVPLGLAFNVLALFHLALAAGAMYYLLRRWSIGPAAALIGAFAYAAAPKIIAHLGVGHVTLVEAWAWLPLVLAGLTPRPPLLKRKSMFQERGGGALLSGLALALCVLADGRMAVYAVLLAGSYVLIVHTRRSMRSWLSWSGALLIVLVVALALSAATWLPALTLTDGTARANLSGQEAGALSLDAVYVLGVLIADRSGAAERTTFFGLVVLVLATVALKWLWSTQRRLWVWFILVLVGGLFMALGTHTPLYDAVYRLPGSTLLRVPARAWFMLSFALAALAGFGVQVLRDWAGRPRLRSRWLALTLGLFALLLGLFGGFALGSISLLALAIFVPLALALIWLRLTGRLQPDRFTALIGLLLVVDLLAVDWALYRPIGLAEAFADGQVTAAWLADQSGSFRVYSPSYSVPQHVGQQYHLQQADGIDPLQIRRYVRFMWQASGVGEWTYAVTLPAFVGMQTDADIRTALQNVEPNAALLGLLGVKYVAAAFPLDQPDLIERTRTAESFIYENRRVLPRAFLVKQVDVAASPQAAEQWLAAHEVFTTAVVEGLPQPIEWPVQPGEAEIAAWSADHIEIDATGPGWLVLSEIVAPDWEASLDGSPAVILPTDLALRGVYAPWGRHIITFDYRPRRVYAGVLISALSVAAVGVALVVKRIVKHSA
jgi:hypothetical protein